MQKLIKLRSDEGNNLYHLLLMLYKQGYDINNLFGEPIVNKVFLDYATINEIFNVVKNSEAILCIVDTNNNRIWYTKSSFLLGRAIISGKDTALTVNEAICQFEKLFIQKENT